MSMRRVQIVILCEDSQHEAFIRRFLKGMGWDNRGFRVEKSPGGRGSAEQYVREKFPNELNIFRQRKNKAASALITMIDADIKTVSDRITELEGECSSHGVGFRTDDEAVAIAVPKRNIETWIMHLNGKAVNEKDKYPKLNRARECKPAVENLVQCCKTMTSDKDFIPSLAAACDEYNRRVSPLK